MKLSVINHIVGQATGDDIEKNKKLEQYNNDREEMRRKHKSITKLISKEETEELEQINKAIKQLEAEQIDIMLKIRNIKAQRHERIVYYNGYATALRKLFDILVIKDDVLDDEEAENSEE